MQEVIGSTPIFSTIDSTAAFRKGRRFLLVRFVGPLCPQHAPQVIELAAVPLEVAYQLDQEVPHGAALVLSLIHI